MYRGLHGIWLAGGWGFLGGWWGLLVAALSAGALATGVLALRRTRNGMDATGRKGLEILEERFAKGDLDVETFKSMRAELDGSEK